MGRRLAAILVADVVGFSRLMEADEAATLAALKDRRKAVVEPLVRQYDGRIVKFMGDGVLVEFASVVNAVACSINLQQRMAQLNADVPDDRRIVVRIGVNLGDLVGEGSDIFGDGVNVAARLEALAHPGGICISGKVHDEVAGKIDFFAEDLGEVALKNIARPVRALRIGPRAEIAPAANGAGRDKPSVAVLPFDNMSGDPGQQYLSDGMTEDIITELSRFRAIAVMARYASFTSARSGAGTLQVARELGVDYAVEGSIRRAGSALRVTAQLIDARTGKHVWAERYDRDVADVFAMQDEVVAAIAATIEGRLASAGAASARARPTASWSAYDYLLQGREFCNYHDEPRAVPYFEKAIAIDPGFADAHAWLALALTLSFHFDADQRTLDRALVSAQGALELDAGNPNVHWANAVASLWLRRYEKAERHFHKAILLNPSDGQFRADRANLYRYTGRLEEGLTAIDEVIKQNILCPQWFWVIRGQILFDLRRYRETLAAFDNQSTLGFPSYLYVAAAHALLGEVELAGACLGEVRKIKPEISRRDLAAVMPYADAGLFDHFIEGVRKAGLDV